MKYKIGDGVLIKALIESVEIHPNGNFYNLRSLGGKVAKVSEDHIISDESSPAHQTGEN